jgi:PIN domain nuclease of toxin-antitoxin system
MIIMDTHIWLWWVNEDIDLLGRARTALIQHADIVGISAISCFEDRIIIATALSHDAQLMSADGKFPLYKDLDGRLL